MADRILAVCDFAGNPVKFERHIGPLARTADPTVVCITAGRDLDGVTYCTVPSFGLRPVGLVAMFVRAVFEALRREYRGLVSISLIPHGCIALATARFAGWPVHLGIIGADLDVHARAWYGPLVAWLLRRFDVVSVPGTTHAQELDRLGVDPRRVAVLSNPVDVETYQPPAGDVHVSYDYLWVGRFGPEKDPIRFVEAVDRLVDEGRSVRAAMVGDGPLAKTVEAEIAVRGLGDVIELPGWVESPIEYYHRSRVFVLTSRRDALPLTLVEAMATGLACVVPDVGNVRDVAHHNENALVVEDRSAAAFAQVLRELHDDPERAARLGTNATRIRDSYSYEAAAADWEAVLEKMGIG